MNNRIFIKIFLIVLLCYRTSAFACDACQKQQPEITKGFTHGVGPESDWDWFIVGLVALVTLFTFYYSLKFLLKPGEKEGSHIKKSVLKF